MKFFIYSLFIFFIPNLLWANSLLYSVEREGKTSYILGTAHSVQAPLEEINLRLPDIIKGSRVLLVETEDTLDRYTGIVDLLDVALQNPNYSDSKKVSAGAKKKIKKYVSSLSGDIEWIKNYWEKMPPGIALALLEANMLGTKNTVTTNILIADSSNDQVFDAIESGLDMKIMSLAKELSIPMIFLDSDSRYTQALLDSVTVQDLSLYAMENIPNASQEALEKVTKVEDLPQSMQVLFDDKEVQDTKKALKEIEELYLDENVQGIFDYVNNSKRLDYFKKVSVRRNKLWSPKIIEEFSKGDALVAVGLSHLHEKYKSGVGLLEILKQKGFTVTSLRRKNSIKVSGNVSMSCSQLL